MTKSFYRENITAIIPAAGIGQRMKSNCPKQYLTIGNSSVLEYSIQYLLSHQDIKKIIIVLNQNDNYFSMSKLSKNNNIMITTGGQTRAESILEGLKLVKKESNWILIHDAVRPCLNLNDLSRLILSLKNNKIGSILATQAKDTMKVTKSINNKTVIVKTIPRKNLWHALTPQIFHHNLLKKCLQNVINIKTAINITDESLVLEYYRYYPEVVVGSSSNIKITTPEDLEFAKFYLKTKNQGKSL